MNENARQRQNPRAKGWFGGFTKPPVQGAKRLRNCREVRSPQNLRGCPKRREPRQAPEFGPADRLTPAHPRPHRGGKKSPPKEDPVPLTPTRGDTDPARRSGQRPGMSPLPGGRPRHHHNPPSWHGADPHIPFRGPHTQMRRSSSLSRGVPQTLTPLRIPRKAGEQILSHPSYIRGWREGEVVTQSQSLTGCVRRDPPADGHPRPSHPSEWGDRPRSAKGSPRPSHSSVWGTDTLTASHGRGRGKPHSPTPLRGM